MADEQGGTPALKQHDPVLSEIATKFSSRFPDFRCSVCGTEDFFMIDRDQTGFASRLLIYDGIGQSSSVHFKTTTLACATCGHLYQFLTDVLKGAVIGDRHDDPARP